MHKLRIQLLKKVGRRGSIIVMGAFCLIIVMAFLAFSADWGYMVVTASELQHAADASALSAARALRNSRSAAVAAAQYWAAKNTAAGVPVATVAKEDVEVGLWDDDRASFTPLSTNSTTSPNAVRVTCRRSAARGNALGLFFAPLIGTKAVDLKATAIARLKSSRCALIIGIPSVTMSSSSHTDSYRSADGPYSKATAGKGGHVCSNGTISMSGSSAINGDAHPGPGQRVKSSSSVGVLGTITPLTRTISFPPADPGDAVWNNNNSMIPLSFNKKQPLNAKAEFSLSGGDVVNLPPGKYYFSKLTLSGGSSITISGYTEIYVTGDVALSGGSLSNLTRLPRNLQLFAMGARCVISGTSEFYGVVYAPTAKVERSGDSDYFGAIIAGELVLSGSGGIHADESLDLEVLGTGIQRSTLVQ